MQSSYTLAMNPSCLSSGADETCSAIVVINKPPRVTSSGVVTRVKGVMRRMKLKKIKVGHAGTLDPFATGVLLVLIGRATKMSEALMGCPKQYEAIFKLGCTTETDDPEAFEIPTTGVGPVHEKSVRAALALQVGMIEQRPPVYSALKIGGKRACDRVRRGEAVQLAPRRVQINSIDLIEYNWPIARVRINCGRGTYIRSIARDVGQHLGVGAYVLELCRTRVGEYHIENAVNPGQLSPQRLWELIG
jgi:tRNA pseudouridine55 synthase